MPIAVRLLRWLIAFAWCVIGGWTAFVAYFTLPVQPWLAISLAAAIALVFLVALRERLLVRGPSGLGFGRIPLTIASLAVFAAAIIWYGSRVPNPNQNWESYHKVQPIVEIDGDKVRVKNVRDFTWRSATDFTPAYEERVYDTKLASSMYYLLVPLRGLDIVAHAMVCFGFSDGQYVAVSIEARRPEGVPFKVFDSLFQQYQLIYAIGEERDLVGMRAQIRNDPIRFYPLRSTPERKGVLFADMMRRAGSLEKHPEFYNLITNNCLNNFTDHLRCLGGTKLPSDFRMLFTGWTDRIAYDGGYIDTKLPFDKARELFLIDDWIRSTKLDDTFSKRLREELARREAEALKSLGSTPSSSGR